MQNPLLQPAEETKENTPLIELMLGHLTREVAELKDRLNRHKHTGIDFTQSLDKDLILSGNFTNTITISDLDGNTDKDYLLLFSFHHTTAIAPTIRLNADAGANYNNIQHEVARITAAFVHQAMVTNANTSGFLTYAGTQSFREFFGILRISAQSGRTRKISYQVSAFTDNNNESELTGNFIWTNTTANLTSITITTGAITAGEYKLFKLK